MRGQRLGDDEAGFTLVEVVVAAVMLGLVALMMVPVLLTGLRATTQARASTVTTQAAQQELDQARALGCSAVVAAATRSPDQQTALVTAPAPGLVFRQRVLGTAPCTPGSTYVLEVSVSTTNAPVQTTVLTTTFLVP